MKKYILIIVCLCSSQFLLAQDELLGLLSDSGAVKKAEPVTAPFKSNRLVNGHSTEMVSAKHLDLKIHHRFGRLSDGPYEFFGLDKAYMILGFEYGLHKNLSVGLLRSNQWKFYTGSIKWRIAQQKKGGKGSFPVSLAYYANMGVNGLSWKDQGVDQPGRINYFSNRLSYFHQLLISHKVNHHVSLQVAPFLFHRNLVVKANEPNDLYGASIGGSFRINGSTRFNVEYMPIFNTYDVNMLRNPLSFCLDIETGGHVFQLVLSNGRGMVENILLMDTPGRWSKGDIYFGFNLLRFFSLKGKG